jgi:hypothetical protein
MAGANTAERRIISICSAPGWGALLEETDEVGSETSVVTLAAWALLEDDEGKTYMVGLVQRPRDESTAAGTFGFADEIEGFAGYSNQGLKTKRADA